MQQKPSLLENVWFQMYWLENKIECQWATYSNKKQIKRIVKEWKTKIKTITDESGNKHKSWFLRRTLNQTNLKRKRKEQDSSRKKKDRKKERKVAETAVLATRGNVDMTKAWQNITSLVETDLFPPFQPATQCPCLIYLCISIGGQPST